MLSGMEVIKTYPSEVEQVRAGLIESIEQIKSRYEEKAKGPTPERATALQMASAPRAAEDFANLQRDYQAEIEPYVQQLVKLEGLATVSFLIPNDQ